MRALKSLYRQSFSVGSADRVRLKPHAPAIVWLTGLSGAGKSTIADGVEARLNRGGVHTAVLDGDNLRLGLNADLGFGAADRNENVRRVAAVARLMADAGLVVLCPLISPFRRERAMAREAAGAVAFFEVFVDAPLATCIERDPKGLYRRALAGEIRDFTGLDQPYEAPEAPQLVVGREGETAEAAVERVIAALVAHGCIDAASVAASPGHARRPGGD